MIDQLQMLPVNDPFGCNDIIIVDMLNKKLSNYSKKL